MRKIKLILFLLCSFLSFSVISQPANDNCTGAIPLTVGASCSYTLYTNASATASTTPSTPPAPGCASYLGGDVWFSAVVPASGNLIIDSDDGVMTDGGMAAYSGTCGSLTLILCNDDGSANGLMPMLDLTGLTPGSTIYIRFWEFSNDNNGTFSICAYEPPPPVPPPANSLCSGADPFCTGTTYNFPNVVDAPDAEVGPDYGCLGTQPNPVWYFLKIATSGPLTINIASSCGDVDYAAWGPFATLTCDPANLTTSGNFMYEDIGASTEWEVDAFLLPSGNMIDCSYDISATEVLTIPNAIIGQYYLVMITNYANCSGNITFNQTSGTGATDCSIMAPPCACDSVCVGETIQLTADLVAGATYAWTGPNSFNSNLQNPTISNATPVNAGVYSLIITVGGVSSAPVTCTVVVNPIPIVGPVSHN